MNYTQKILNIKLHNILYTNLYTTAIIINIYEFSGLINKVLITRHKERLQELGLHCINLRIFLKMIYF